MTYKGIAAALAVAALLPACQVIAPDKRPDFDSVQLKRGGCYGECPVYAVEVLADGTVNYTGERHVQTTGVRHAKLKAARLSLLSLAIEHADFWELRDKYDEAADGCVGMTTDQPSLTITVKRADKTKSIRYYKGCTGPGVPSKKLAWLGQTMDEMADTKRFTGR
jgi:hypothetical protein